MSYTATVAAAACGSAQPVAYRDEPECSPPPYPYCERQLPPQFFNHVNQPLDDPPEYNYYDVERGSLIDRALAQYARSVSPSVASTRYTILEHDEGEPQPAPNFSGRLRSLLFYCMAMFCGITWATFWVCAIGYAIVISFQKIAQSLV
jgi:hypothetical protein